MYDWKRKGDGGLIKEVTRDGVTWLSFPALEETGLVAHAFSTRMGGVSKGCLFHHEFFLYPGRRSGGGTGKLQAYGKGPGRG